MDVFQPSLEPASFAMFIVWLQACRRYFIFVPIYASSASTYLVCSKIEENWTQL